MAGAQVSCSAPSKAAPHGAAPRGPVATGEAFRAQLAALTRLVPPRFAGGRAGAPSTWLRATLTPYFDIAEAQRVRTEHAAALAMTAAATPVESHRIAREFANAWTVVAGGIEAAAEPAFDAAFDDQKTHAVATAELARRLAANRISAFDRCASVAAFLEGTPAEDGSCAREAARLRERVAAAERDAAATAAAARAPLPWMETTSAQPCAFAGSLRTVVGADLFATRDAPANAAIGVLAPSDGVVVAKLDMANETFGRVEIRITRPIVGTFFVDRTVPWVELAARVVSADGSLALVPGASVHVLGVVATSAATVAPVDAATLIAFSAASTPGLTAPCEALRLAGSGTFGRDPLRGTIDRESPGELAMKHIARGGAWLSRDRAGKSPMARLADVDVAVLETVGERTRVRATVTPLTVAGWVDTASLEARIAPYYAIVNVEPFAIEGRAVDVARDEGLPIYARAKPDERAVTRISKGTTVFVGRELPGGYIEVRLRELREKNPAAPFVARATEVLAPPTNR